MLGRGGTGRGLRLTGGRRKEGLCEGVGGDGLPSWVGSDGGSETTRRIFPKNDQKSSFEYKSRSK